VPQGSIAPDTVQHFGVADYEHKIVGGQTRNVTSPSALAPKDSHAHGGGRIAGLVVAALVVDRVDDDDGVHEGCQRRLDGRAQCG
jgi:hypothetical protein